MLAINRLGEECVVGKILGDKCEVLMSLAGSFETMISLEEREMCSPFCIADRVMQSPSSSLANNGLQSLLWIRITVLAVVAYG